MSENSKELAEIRAGIEVLKRRLLEQILAELEERIRLREARESRPLRITSIGDDGCGVIAPAR